MLDASELRHMITYNNHRRSKSKDVQSVWFEWSPYSLTPIVQSIIMGISRCVGISNKSFIVVSSCHVLWHPPVVHFAFRTYVANELAFRPLILFSYSQCYACFPSSMHAPASILRISCLYMGNSNQIASRVFVCTQGCRSLTSSTSVLRQC